MRVLLIEDAPTNGDAVALALKEASYAVDRARDGDAGLLLFASQRYEMVQVDLDLPERDGTGMPCSAACGSVTPRCRSWPLPPAAGRTISGKDWIWAPTTLFASRSNFERCRSIQKQPGLFGQKQHSSENHAQPAGTGLLNRKNKNPRKGGGSGVHRHPVVSMLRLRR